MNHRLLFQTNELELNGPGNVHNEYPRPQLVRDNWLCLNGLWDYAITPDDEAPFSFEGEIQVPFSPESPFSLVNKQLQPLETLWYQRIVRLHKPTGNRRLLLHFGAVDCVCSIYVNDTLVGEHAGGYWAFSIDITQYVKEGVNKIQLAIKDQSEFSNEAYGKQRLRARKDWHTAQSGIWQTVWCEEVSDVYIENLKMTPNLGNDTIHIQLQPSKASHIFEGEVHVYHEDKHIATARIIDNEVIVPILDVHTWTPDDPFLYDVDIQTKDDHVATYFGMREFGVHKTKDNNIILTLNGVPIFHHGVSDQGYYGDGLYTPFDDEVSRNSILMAKKLGFNMIRKHAKIESMRWYYHCDTLGMLVWQDFVNGGLPYEPTLLHTVVSSGIRLKDTDYKRFGRRDANGRQNFIRDAARTIEQLYNCVSIATWIPFYEGRGQFDSKKMVHFIETKDTTRYIDHASGYYDQGVGDFFSVHPNKAQLLRARNKRILAMTSLRYKGNKKYANHDLAMQVQERTNKIRNLYEKEVYTTIEKGLSVSIYDQLSDTEQETQGLYLEDRETCKVDVKQMQEIAKTIALLYKNKSI